ncbi:hypothetical protein GCM10022243_14690 [Saccharothrix violaceirubra]|uniref:DUF397 domain-containing protein n=1 Tax=Saccharothrix violaceirubra TaxID=413306 RepID=A0A7W7T692_9PSEU|nr:DUF397 domain-containing protein [Saccharothrix violaceirubra]MBB4967344.1 hypothetical protein [Saccharothrix violaceirubra]
MNDGRWRKSSHSVGNPEQCVEVAATLGVRAIRDSKDPDKRELSFTDGGFDAFLRTLRRGLPVR